LDAAISYSEFMKLLGVSTVSEDTIYEFTRGDAANILAHYLTQDK
jgi:hypothetical protein